MAGAGENGAECSTDVEGQATLVAVRPEAIGNSKITPFKLFIALTGVQAVQRFQTFQCFNWL